MRQELENILVYWMQHAVDHAHGGFYGKIDHANHVHAYALKGSVLNSRILWAFSAAYNLTGNAQYRLMADRAYQYILDCFIDPQYGGVYWSVDHKGQPADTKKQIYALAFAAYGLSEYHRCSNSEKAKQQAVALYHAIEQHSYDGRAGGYLEAFTIDWQEIKDLRLSSKDANEKKSMNTHLHVLEAYATLYHIWPDATLKNRITELIRIFLDHITDPQTHHLILFFDEAWNVKSDIISYGHDAEAAWLVEEAATAIADEALIHEVKQRSVKIAVAAARGLDTDGGLWYEKEAGRLVKEKHWWPQSEAMVGFLNAWQISGDKTFLDQSLSCWKFVRQHILDKDNGEWVWGVKADYTLMQHEDKAGIWKCPYHNSRACMEIVRRLDTFTD